MVRYGTIGSGWIVDAFIAGAQQGAPQLEHRAVYSRSRETGEAFARKHGVNLVFTDLEALAASDQIDAVYIASPNAFHYSQAKLFLEHGKHVLCEKTCVVNSAQMKELCRLADQNGVVFMEAIKFMHLPERLILREALAFVGPVHLARFDFSRYSSKFPQYLAGQCPNIFNPKMAAGCLMDMGIYSVFPAVHLFGLPRRVSASAVMLRTGADGAGAALLEYPDKVACLSYSKMSDAHLDNVIQGEKGVLHIRTIEHLNEIDLHHNDGRVETIARRDESRLPMSYEAYDFGRFADDPNGTWKEHHWFREQSVRNLAVMDQIRQSAGIRFDADQL